MDAPLCRSVNIDMCLGPIVCVILGFPSELVVPPPLG